MLVHIITYKLKENVVMKPGNNAHIIKNYYQVTDSQCQNFFQKIFYYLPIAHYLLLRHCIVFIIINFPKHKIEQNIFKFYRLAWLG